MIIKLAFLLGTAWTVIVLLASQTGRRPQNRRRHTWLPKVFASGAIRRIK